MRTVMREMPSRSVNRRSLGKNPRIQQPLLDGLAHRGVEAQIQRHRARAGQILLQFVQQTLVGLLAHSRRKSCSRNAMAYLGISPGSATAAAGVK
ncbi:hypothetical protein M5585_19220 [Serratia ureilytica]